MRIRRAIVSVSEKMGVVDFATSLAAMGVEIVSCGKTEAFLGRGGVPVRPLDEFTGMPDVLGGRVRTLHSKIHGGILNTRGDPDHEREKSVHGIQDVGIALMLASARHFCH
jgi:phosphoribosylaminoimidazolecarboxamide formyltransferase/IMP cyclohydrolase